MDEATIIKKKVRTRGDHWYETGDIVLASYDDEDEMVQHRVHGQVLCVKGSIFEEKILQAKAKEHPTVYLDDKTEDLNALLHALYKGLGLLSGNQLTFDMSLSILLMSDKYKFEALRSAIIRILQEQWPIRRIDYLNRQRLLDDSSPRVLKSLKLIKIAQQCGVPSLLPTCLYEVSTSPISSWNTEEHQACEQLAPADLIRMMTGRENATIRLCRLLSKATPVFWNANTETPSTSIFQYRESFPVCKIHKGEGNLKHCSYIFTLLEVHFNLRLWRGYTPFQIVSEMTREDISSKKEPHRTCSNCVDWMMSVLENKENEMWNSIPEDYQLDTQLDTKLYTEPLYTAL